MIEDDVMPPWCKCFRSFCDGSMVDLHHPIGRYLRHKHFCDERQALVKGGVDPRNDHQEQKEQHKVDATGQNEAGSHENGRCHAQAHDHAGGIDKDACAQFATDHDALVLVDFAVKSLKIPLLLICRSNLPDVFQRFLNAVGYAHRGLFCPLGAAAGKPARAEQQAERHRYAPQTGEHQPPIVGQQADRDNRCGDIGAIQIA